MTSLNGIDTLLFLQAITDMPLCEALVSYDVAKCMIF